MAPCLIWDMRRVSAPQRAPVAKHNLDIKATCPVPIGAPVRRWFFDHSNPTFLYKTLSYYDRANDLVYFYYVSKKSNDTLDACLLYNTKTQQWGRANRSITAVLDYISSGLTYDEFGK